jgi:hypothetical protein
LQPDDIERLAVARRVRQPKHNLILQAHTIACFDAIMFLENIVRSSMAKEK